MPTSPAPKTLEDNADVCVPYVDWLMDMHNLPNGISVRDYQSTTSDNRARLMIVEATRFISFGVRSRILRCEQITEDEERVNHYMFTADAKTFWTNGIEAGNTPQEILDGWEAFQSVLKETTATNA